MDDKICQNIKFNLLIHAHSFLGTTKHLEKIRLYTIFTVLVYEQTKI